MHLKEETVVTGLGILLLYGLFGWCCRVIS